MNSEDLNEKISSLEAALQHFESGFDMDDMRLKRSSYIIDLQETKP